MRLTRTTIALVPLAALLLGACQSIFGGSGGVKVSARSDIEAGDAFAEAQLAVGRAALVEGRYAAAIASFSKARSAPALAAEALNGMAVAYAGIGRLDLAERYFLQAIAIAPEDERFRRNLARLQTIGPALQEPPDQPQMAQSRTAQPPASEVRAATPVPRTFSPVIRVALPENGLTRVSPGEVVLRTASASVPSEQSGGKAMVRIDLTKIARPAL